MSRRILPREEMARRGPLLGLSLVLMLAAFVLIGAFLEVAVAKRVS